MAKVTHSENVKMRYTMKTNARRALKSRFGDAARAAHEELIHEDEIGFYIVESECRAVVRKAEQAAKQTAPAPTAAPAPAANVLRAQPNPVVVAAALEALKEEEVKDAKHAKAVKAVKPIFTCSHCGREYFEGEAKCTSNDCPKNVVKAIVDKKAARCDFKNGARKPLKGKTAEVWAMGDKLLAELGRTPELKEMKAAMPSFNGTTVAIQFYAWRKYNGLEG